MKIVRKIVGGLILFFDKVFSPKPVSRDPQVQSQIDQAALKLKLYQFHACPFCVKVRRALKRLNLNVELRDVKMAGAYRDELLERGGRIKAPCLRIEGDDGQYQWMYESSDIVAYLDQRFS